MISCCPDVKSRLERAFTQSLNWSAERTWRRAVRELTEGNYGFAAGFILRLAGKFCVYYKFALYRTAAKSLYQLLGELSFEEKKILFELCCDTITELRDELEEEAARYSPTDPDTWSYFGEAVEFWQGDVDGEVRTWLSPLLTLLTGIADKHASSELDQAIMRLEAFKLAGVSDFQQVLEDMVVAFEVQEQSEPSSAMKRDWPDYEARRSLYTLYACGEAFAPTAARATSAARAQSIERSYSISRGIVAYRAADMSTAEEESEPNLKDPKEASPEAASKGQRTSESKHQLSNSIQATNALVKRADLALAEKREALKDYILDLTNRVNDESQKLSEYELRRIYGISCKIQKVSEFAEVAEELQRKIFELRERALGYDMSMAVSLYRLISLWQVTGRLKDGESFCNELLKRVSTKLDEHDIVLRQIESAARRVEDLSQVYRTLSDKSQQEAEQPAAKAIPSVVSYEEFDEFVSMLSVVALDHFHFGRYDEAERVLAELCAYYFECSSDIARRVGEMLWLLLETDLCSLKSFCLKLVELSFQKAFDTYLRRRAEHHLKRLVHLQADDFFLSDTFEMALRTVFEKESGATDLEGLSLTMSDLRHVKRLPTNLDDIAGADFDLENENSDPDLQNVFVLNALAEQKRWDDVVVLLDKITRSGNQIKVRALIKFSKRALDERQYELAEKGLRLAGPLASRLYLAAICELAEQFAAVYRKLDDLKGAARVLNIVLEMPVLSREERNRFLLRLANVHVAANRIFDAVAVTHMAYSGIPEPYDDEPESEPRVLLSDS